MKTKLLIFIPVLAFIISLSTISCQKDPVMNLGGDTVYVPMRDTIRIHDTVYVHDWTPITKELITSGKWTAQEERGVYGANIMKYIRGGADNSESFDNATFVFNSNFTGVGTENNGTVKNITWAFGNADNTKMTLSYTNTPANFIVTWENIRFKDGKLYLDQYYTDGNTGANAHMQVVKTKMP